MSQQVTCINKHGNHYDPHERIKADGVTQKNLLALPEC